MGKRDWFYPIFIAFALGVALRSFIDLGTSFLAFLGVLSAFLLIQVFVTQGSKKISSGLLVVLVVVSFGVGVFRFEITDHREDETSLDAVVGSVSLLEGVIITDPETRESSQKFVVDVTYQNTTAKVVVFADSYPELAYGDLIQIEGVIEHPQAFETDAGKVFNYPAYLAKDDVFYQIRFPDIDILSSENGNFFKAQLFTLKNAFVDSISRSLPQPHAALVGGLVVGAQESLGEELLDDFRKTGLIHIVVLSGYNVTIVAENIMRVFSFLPGIFGMALGGIGIVMFAILTGAGATIVRASIMALLVLVARATHRTYDITRALVVAGAIMVLHNPKILAFDVSFQLSFLATLGLIYFVPKIETRLRFVPRTAHLRGFAAATIATQLFVLPLLLFRVGELSLVAVPVNILVLAVIPLTMLVGFLTAMLGLLWAPLAIPFAFGSFALISYELGVVELFARLPIASVAIPAFPAWLVVVWYGVYAWLLYRLHTKTSLVHSTDE